jgi:hypothetical protein
MSSHSLLFSCCTGSSSVSYINGSEGQAHAQILLLFAPDSVSAKNNNNNNQFSFFSKLKLTH